jgi:uncharacterized RDD family membrane protein YckC
LGRNYVVRTPEQVFFRYELAGPIERGLAWLLDASVIFGLTAGVSGALAPSAGLGLPLLFVAVFVIQWGYFVFFEWRWNGASPGKRVLRLRVIQSAGVRCGLERAVLRNFLRVVDSLPLLYLVGGLAALLTRHGQRVGDLAAGTLVVRVPATPPPAAVAEIRTRYNSLRDDAAARARIRQLLSPREAELVIGLALRRELLEREARLRLMERAAAYLRRRLRLAGHDALPDERLLLDVAAVLLAERVL